MRNTIAGKDIHQLFVAGLFFKGIFAVVEIVGGVFMFFTSKKFIVALVTYSTQKELSSDPGDVIAQYLVRTANEFSLTTQHAVSVYLFGHGLIKLLLIIGLLQRKIWVYPLALCIFSGLIFYQIERYTQTHSVWLLIITAVDMLVIALTWYEYRHFKRTTNN